MTDTNLVDALRNLLDNPGDLKMEDAAMEALAAYDAIAACTAMQSMRDGK